MRGGKGCPIEALVSRSSKDRRPLGPLHVREFEYLVIDHINTCCATYLYQLLGVIFLQRQAYTVTSVIPKHSTLEISSNVSPSPNIAIFCLSYNHHFSDSIMATIGVLASSYTTYPSRSEGPTLYLCTMTSC